MDINDNVTPIRALRHDVAAHLVEIANLLVGEPGLSKDEQIARIDGVIGHLDMARGHMVEAKEILVARDEQAHAEYKQKIASAPLN